MRVSGFGYFLKGTGFVDFAISIYAATVKRRFWNLCLISKLLLVLKIFKHSKIKWTKIRIYPYVIPDNKMDTSSNKEADTA